MNVLFLEQELGEGGGGALQYDSILFVAVAGGCQNMTIEHDGGWRGGGEF